MITTAAKRILLLTIATMFVCTSAYPQAGSNRGRPITKPAAAMTVSDSLEKGGSSHFDDMARRVDSLQFIVVYNAELLQKDFGSKVLWIYVMLGVMIVASFAMYGSLRQVRRNREDLDALTAQLSSSVAQFESEIRTITEKVNSIEAKSARRPTRKRK